MRAHYSIIIQLNDDIIFLFKNLKELLKSKIGWYSSCNSEAHITILEFNATPEEARYIIEKLLKIVQKQVEFNATFTKISSSEHTACTVVLPHKDYKKDFQKLFSRIRKYLNIKEPYNGSEAHISIGRKLSAQQLQISQETFTDVDINFSCNQLALRKLNEEKKQFEIIKIFPFVGKPDNSQQLALGF